MNEHNQFLFAILLCIGVLFLWQFLVIEPKIDEEAAQAEQIELLPIPDRQTPQSKTIKEESTGGFIEIKSQNYSGKLSLQGARIDSLYLSQYKKDLNNDNGAVRLFAPPSYPNAWYGVHGFLAEGMDVPSEKTKWRALSTNPLTPQTPIILEYRSKQNIRFQRTIAVDENFLFTITDKVTNKSRTPITLYPYAQLKRAGIEDKTSFFILHEGAIAVSEEQGLEEISYKDLLKQGNEAGGFTKREQQGGWIGLTDKYWAAALLPPQDEQIRTRLGHVQKEAVIDYSLQGKTIAAGEQVEITQHYFAGAKEVGLIDHYKKDLAIHRFDLLIDWGWFYFLTKPLFLVIDMLYGIFGNFGVAILMMTILIKLLFFPLANKSYIAMGRMKKLQPRIAEITKTHKDNPQAKQLAIMALYKQEKVNPLAGCLPVLIQIPVFFALYKVLFVTIEMRHQPFFGWIHDLSAPDPTNIFTLFGLLPISLPAFLTIGIWPICMGLTMFVQMQMNPAPPDPIQKRIFFWMPIVFTFVLAGFPAGLVIYWTWNNMLSVLQQGVIMKKQGVRIELWDNLFSRKKNDQD